MAAPLKEQTEEEREEAEPEVLAEIQISRHPQALDEEEEVGRP